MKKSILLLVLTVSLCLSSCNLVPFSTTGTTVPAETTTTEAPISTPSQDLSIRLPNCHSLEEYEKAIAEAKNLPENFIFYDQIKELGNFYSCYF